MAHKNWLTLGGVREFLPQHAALYRRESTIGNSTEVRGPSCGLHRLILLGEAGSVAPRRTWHRERARLVPLTMRLSAGHGGLGIISPNAPSRFAAKDVLNGLPPLIGAPPGLMVSGRWRPVMVIWPISTPADGGERYRADGSQRARRSSARWPSSREALRVSGDNAVPTIGPSAASSAPPWRTPDSLTDDLPDYCRYVAICDGIRWMNSGRRGTRFVLGEWSRHSDLNRGPAVYETAALPLSYVGVARV